MAKCGCSGDACGCSLVAGSRITITGTGAAQNPFRISADPMRLQVADSDTISMTLTGEGTVSSPYVMDAEFIGELNPPDWTPSEGRSWGAGAQSLADLDAPATVRVALTGNVTGVTLPSWASSDSGSITLVITQDGTGGRTLVLTGVTWAGGTPPTYTTAANGRDLIRLFWTGLAWIGEPVALNVS